MFVRLKRVRSYRYLQLVESVRADDKPRQRVLATLGRVEELQAEGSIDALVRSLSKFSPNALALIVGEAAPDTQALTIGPVIIFQRLWQRLKLDQILKELLRERHFGFAVERAIFLCVLHRICWGGSDRHSHQWKGDYEIAGVSQLSLHQSYRAMAWLGQAEPRKDKPAAEATTPPAEVEGKQASAAVAVKSTRGPAPIYRWHGLKDQIEKSLWVERQDLFNNLSVVFFDTTSLYFEGAGGPSLGQRGHSKDSRPDLAQVVVGVVLDGQGEPLCCEMWPGNAADVKGLLPVLENVRERFGIGRVCVVADRGFISKETLEKLEKKEGGWDFILGVRMRASKEARDEVVGKLGKPGGGGAAERFYGGAWRAQELQRPFPIGSEGSVGGAAALRALLQPGTSAQGRSRSSPNCGSAPSDTQARRQSVGRQQRISQIPACGRQAF
jgi:hypothetical protein